MRRALTVLAAVAAAGWAGAQEVAVSVNASQTVRIVDERVFALNTACWDWALNYTPSIGVATTGLLEAAGVRALRFPGGSTADVYFWTNNTTVDERGTLTQGTDFDQFASVATGAGCQVFITVNYGTSTPTDAANWVAYSNVQQGYHFKYWEIGNESFGSWEDDAQAIPHDPYTYATRALSYITQMKAADPTIKIGVVITLGEDSYANNMNHSATNPRTGVVHYGWTPVVLSTLRSLGVTPDFAIYHRYEQAPGAESDPALLQAALTWPNDAAELRRQLTDYLGSAGAGVELVVTENNSVGTSPGKQTTSIVNGLYMADSVANVMQTEFNALIWWDLHDGQVNGNNNSPALYGWRNYGDYGVLTGQNSADSNNELNQPYPTYYVMKLLSHFARGGDTIVQAGTNNPLLSAYAATRTDGTLTLLVINKSPTATYAADFALTGFTPKATATVYSYGLPQDAAAQTGLGSPDLATTTLTNAAASFSTAFAPYSLSVLSLSPASSTPVSSGPPSSSPPSSDPVESAPTTPPTNPSLSTNPAAPPVPASSASSNMAAAVQPASQTVTSGRSAVFSFSASGSPAPTYQWYWNNIALAGATDPTLVMNAVSAASAGTIACLATNSSGTLLSAPATLSVVGTSDPGRLIDVSARALAGTGGDTLIAGFVVGGRGTAGTQALLIRGSGPSLGALGVTGVLPDPLLQLFNGSSLLAENEGWNGNAQIRIAAASVGAFAWSDGASKDSALLISAPAGGYTANISGASGDTGVALAEAYDATATGGYTLATPRLINISARVRVGTSGNILIEGFVIGGTTSTSVLVRASGPALGALGVANPLPDPLLQLYQGTTLLASNSGWGGSRSIANAAAYVGAFPWSQGASPDAALLLTLAPGAYTVKVSGANNDTGVALAEIYELQ